MEYEKEVIIIGGGPIGLACGIAAKDAGRDYLILEKGTLVNSLFHYPLFMTFFSTAERLEIGNIPFPCVKPKPGRQEALEYYRKVTQNKQLKIKLFTGVTNITKQEDGRFLVHTASDDYLAKYVVVATGFYDVPYKMNIPGEELSKVSHYYKEPHEFAFRKVLVVGAQNSAVDAALQCFRTGADVSLLVRGSEIGKRVKYWIRPDIINRIEEGSIRAYFNSQLLAIKEKSVLIASPQGETEIDNDHVLAMTGYRPNNDFLKNLGVRFSNDGKMKPYYNSNTMETNVQNLFLAGVICGGVETHKLIIENSRVHADLIVKTILEK